MRPNLSLPHLAATLAALGTSAVLVAACAGEPKSATTPTGGSAAPDGSAASGLKSDETRTMATASASAAPVAPDATKVGTPTTTATAAASTTPSTGTATVQHKPPPPPGGGGGGSRHGGTTGQASCGAGTCSADIKKK